MTPAPENRSRTGEAVAALAFRSLLPGPDRRPVGQQGVELVGVDAPTRPQPAGEPSGTPGPPHSSGPSGKPSQTAASVRSWGRLLGGVTAHADPDRPQAVDPPHRLDDVDGWGVRPELDHLPARDPRTLVTNVIGSPCRSPADPPIIVVAVGSPDAPTYRG
jgi:hypothetical protein